MSKRGEERHFKQKGLIEAHSHIPGRASGPCAGVISVVRMVVEEGLGARAVAALVFAQSEFHKVLKLLLFLKLKELL